MNEDKKKRELNLLMRVKSLYAPFPCGEIESSEGPDFLISTERNKIGIELTHYVRGQSKSGSKLRKNEVLRDQIIKLARNRFMDKYEERVSAAFHWLRTDLQNGDRRKLADEIVALIATSIPNDIHETTVIEPDGAGEIDGLITRISVKRARPSSKGVWSNWEVGPEGASVEEIQTLIGAKDSKIHAYIRKCQVVWLIIVADGRYISSSAEIDNTVRQHRFKTRFGKILFYYADSRAVHELQVK